MWGEKLFVLGMLNVYIVLGLLNVYIVLGMLNVYIGDYKTALLIWKCLASSTSL
jgi:hypothetical protein